MKSVYVVSKLRCISEHLTTPGTFNMPILPQKADVLSIYNVDILLRYIPHLLTFLSDTFTYFFIQVHYKQNVLNNLCSTATLHLPAAFPFLFLEIDDSYADRTGTQDLGAWSHCWLHRGGPRWQVPLSSVYYRGLGAKIVHL